ncbi:spore coat associated protein CotJA [Clostridiisalibacter paucivorans]|uniref:spore coat associated protein CotJA n=1 Tax=Clostridiisalibacter paucivorans TaxID=408753 RepID=UPI00047C2ACF|nr:spore coat associated protein CotJA [Clostridiisalibacter paucivorans]
MNDYYSQRQHYYEPNMRPKYKLAHAYVPYQVLNRIYTPREALCRGTLFPELFMPYKKSRKDC